MFCFFKLFATSQRLVTILKDKDASSGKFDSGMLYEPAHATMGQVVFSGFEIIEKNFPIFTGYVGSSNIFFSWVRYSVGPLGTLIF